jgi:hypothetical protein
MLALTLTLSLGSAPETGLAHPEIARVADPVSQITVGMTKEEVERILPQQSKFGYGGGSSTTMYYLKSRVSVSFDSNDRALRIRKLKSH